MDEKPVEPGMYVRLSDRVLSEDPADGGGAFGLVGDPLAVGGFIALRARVGIGVYGRQDMTPVPRERVPAVELVDLDARAYGPEPRNGT